MTSEVVSKTVKAIWDYWEEADWRDGKEAESRPVDMAKAFWGAEEVHQRDGKDEEIRSVAADLVALLVVGSAL